MQSGTSDVIESRGDTSQALQSHLHAYPCLGWAIAHGELEVASLLLAACRSAAHLLTSHAQRQSGCLGRQPCR